MLLRDNPRFRALFASASVANLGDGIAALAVPWLATLVTREPVWIGAISAAATLPWLLFALPAGVITDRLDRRALVLGADLVRLGFALALVALVAAAPALPLAEDAPARLPLILALIAIAFAIGTAEVFRDNAAQTLLPHLVDRRDLERANGQIWSTEEVMNKFIGPPAAGVLIATAVYAPFVAYAAAFALAALCVSRIPALPRTGPGPQGAFLVQLGEGLAWLRDHRRMLTLALMLAALNLVSAASIALLVLLSQEIYGLSAAGHGLVLAAGAVGGVAGSLAGPGIAQRLGPRRAVLLALMIMPVPFFLLAVTSSPVVAAIALFLELFAGMLWNVVTVSLRQRVIPDALFGRVNSVYRFFGWGAIPVGAFSAGLLVSLIEPTLGREAALRVPFWIGSGLLASMCVWALVRFQLPEEPA